MEEALCAYHTCDSGADMPRPHHRQNPGDTKMRARKQVRSVQQLLGLHQRHCDGCLITSLWTDTHIHTKRHKYTHTHTHTGNLMTNTLQTQTQKRDKHTLDPQR